MTRCWSSTRIWHCCSEHKRQIWRSKFFVTTCC